MVNAADVLSGNNTRHPGNKSFIDLVKSLCPEHDSVFVGYRRAICDEIILAVKSANGRFLRKDDVTGVWHELDHTAARNRCYRAISNQISFRQINHGGRTTSK